MINTWQVAIAEVQLGRTSLILTLALLLWFLAKSLYHILTNPLQDIPGPTAARFTRFWLFKQYFGGQFHHTNLQLHKKYGQIVRIAPSQYSIDDFEAAKTIYGHGTQFTKSDWYLPWGHPDFANLFNDQNPKTHALLRRQLSQMYSMSSLVSYEGFVDECVEILDKNLTEIAKSGVKADIGRWLQCFAFDVIGKITFSYRFGFLDEGSDIMDLMQEIDGINSYSTMAGVFPFWHRFVAMLIQFFRLGGKGLNFIDKYSQDFAKSCGKLEVQEDSPLDFVRKLLSVRQNDKGIATMELIRNAAGANMIAGSDTTSISLSAVLYSLYKSPATLAKLRKELREAAQTPDICLTGA